MRDSERGYKVEEEQDEEVAFEVLKEDRGYISDAKGMLVGAYICIRISTWKKGIARRSVWECRGGKSCSLTKIMIFDILSILRLVPLCAAAVTVNESRVITLYHVQ